MWRREHWCTVRRGCRLKQLERKRKKQGYVVYGPWVSGWVTRATWKCEGQSAVRKLVTIRDLRRVSETWSMRDRGSERT